VEEIARVYARALFEVAVEHDALDEIRDQLDAFAAALDEHRQLASFFFSPYFSVVEKKEGLARVVVDANPAFDNFLQALLERHRMPAIFRIRSDFEKLWDEERRLLPVQITSAIALDEETVESLGKRIGEQVAAVKGASKKPWRSSPMRSPRSSRTGSRAWTRRAPS
jgi:F-type H+-transporting ATPase subunit delta